MTGATNISLPYIGFGIGISIAVIGGAVEYLLSKRKTNSLQANNLPGCMLFVAGALGLTGLIAVVVSIIMIGRIGPALILGAGVLSGFYIGFALLMILYLVAKRFLPSTDG